MQNKPLMLGITGGIGAGKTTVCRIFNVLGAPVYNADDQAKLLMVTDKNIVSSVKKYFGKSAYFPDGNLNRKYLADQVFKDSEVLEILNGIVHPAVARDFENWSKTHGNKSYIIKEAALLIESGSAKVLDFIASVVAPVDLRVERTLERDPHRTANQVHDIISNQMSDEERISRSQFVIKNDDHTLLIPQVLAIHDFLISKAHIG